MEKNIDLQAFLKGNAKPIEDIEMIVSKRFIDMKENLYHGY